MKKMNVLAIVALLIGTMCVVNPVYSQTSKEEKAAAKAQAKTQKATEKSIFSKAPKEAQKEAKKLEKEGWKSMNLPISKQLSLWEQN